MQMVIDRFGRMVLPKAVRDAFGLHPGDVLEAEKTPETIVLRPTGRSDALRVRGRVLVFGGNSDGNLADTLEKQRNRRLDRLGGQKTSS